ncbi:fibronectin type III domain-containing protein [Treponema denticola]|uniref:fibronectin type III domain-containing protein n=1 Tax=Treponema denticola TaxID=158 RepID=UPI003D8A6EF2
MEKTNLKIKKKFLNRAVFITALLVVAGLLFTGCPQKPEVKLGDKVPPAEVTELKAVAGSGKVSLSWKNPSDEDLYQVEITASPAAGTLANAVYLSAEKSKEGSFIVENLTEGTEYTFTVKTIDTSLNKSKGTSIKKSPRPAGSPMTLNLTQNPTAPTNGNVTISLTSSTSVKTAKWKKGVHSAKDVLASGTTITGNSFEVSENSKYSVGVQDNEGRREVEIIEISNIDKTAPSKVKSLRAYYNSGTQIISLNWDASIDTDFSHYLVSYKKGGTPIVTEQVKTETSFTIENIEPDGSEYEFTLKTVDRAGNKGEEAKISLTASMSPSLTAILLNRKHLAYNDPDLTIRLTITGSNFNLISSQTDTTVKAGIFDEEGALQGSLVTVTSINTGNNQASVDLTAPLISSNDASFEGKRYTVKIKLCGNYSPVTESFVITKEARLTAQPELSLKSIASTEVTGETKTKITITGANLAVAGGIKVRLYNSEGVIEGGEISIDARTQEAGIVSDFKADIPVPQKEGVFIAKVFFGDKEQKEIYSNLSYNYGQNIINPTIQVYGAPKFTSFYIPKAGTSKEDSKLIARVRGTNFKAPGVTPSNFTLSCTDKPSITNGSTVSILSDTELTVELIIPGQAGDYTVTTTSGSQSLNGTFSVKDYSEYTVGKIVLADKTLVDKDSYTAIDSSNPPVAIIAGLNCYGSALGIALHIGPSGLMWAKNGSTGYKTKFEGIICTPSAEGSGAASTATFTGDLDGSDNWHYICSIDPDGTANAAENYPAFDWVNRYNTTYSTVLAGADIKWYMPSLAELCEVYKNRETINESLAKIHGLGNSYADSSLGDSLYWSSSSISYEDSFAGRVDFDNGNVTTSYKDNYYKVCCLAGF